jgi:hypothetical protein
VHGGGGRKLLLMSRGRRWTLGAALVLALLGAAPALAARPHGRFKVGSRAGAVARADAAKQLAAVRFPSGARAVQHDPSRLALGPAWGSNAHQSRSCRLLRQYEAWDSGFWRVPGSPASVWQLMQDHPTVPAFDSGRWYDSNPNWPGKSPPWGIDFIFRNQPNVIGRTDFVTLWFARGGGTAVRVDSEAMRKPPSGLTCGPPRSY